MTGSQSQRAALYSSSNRLLAYPERRSASGLLLAAPPFLRIDAPDAASVAAAVRSALMESTATIPDPRRQEFTRLAQPRLQAAGVRSELAFMRGARLVSVEQTDDAVVVLPHRNGGWAGENKGFCPLAEKAIRLPASVEDVAFGNACIQALAECE